LGAIPDLPGLGVTGYLVNGTNPAFWDSLPWRERYYSRPQLSLLLSEVSINGLACIPSPTAANILARLSNRPYSDGQVSNLLEAVELNREIRARGFAHYIENRTDMVHMKADRERK
jgi:hypothetical protein